MSERMNNEEFVADLMSFSPYGALGQVFIIECITKWSALMAEQDDEACDRVTKKSNGFVDGFTWREIAKDVQARCNEQYGEKK